MLQRCLLWPNLSSLVGTCFGGWIKSFLSIHSLSVVCFFSRPAFYRRQLSRARWVGQDEDEVVSPCPFPAVVVRDGFRSKKDSHNEGFARTVAISWIRDLWANTGQCQWLVGSDSRSPRSSNRFWKGYRHESDVGKLAWRDHAWQLLQTQWRETYSQRSAMEWLEWAPSPTKWKWRRRHRVRNIIRQEACPPRARQQYNTRIIPRQIISM